MKKTKIMRYFALLSLVCVLVCSVSAQQLENDIFLNNSTIHPATLSSISSRNTDEWPTNNCVSDECFAIIQLNDIPNEGQRAVLSELGIELFDYIPNRAYLASCHSCGNIELPDFVAQVFPLDGAEKRPSVPISLAAGPEGLLDYNLVGMPFPGVSTILLAADLIEVGAVITGYDAFRLSYRISADLLPEVLNSPLLQYTEAVPTAPVPEGEIGRSNLRLNGVNQGPGAGYDGSGISIAIADDGKVNHLDFYGRLEDHTQYDFGTHGEMTAGMAAGAGNIDQLAQGAAPNATIHLFDIGNYEHITDAVANFNQYEIVITSTSYGEGCGDDYNFSTQAIDDQVFQNSQLLHCFSAGNHGTDPCFNPYSFLGPNAQGTYYATQTGGRKAGKNVLAVGNNSWNDEILLSSSLGPTFDGRIKPDLCALGQADYTTGNQNTYRQSSGTSAAAPNVAGSLACLYQYYKETHGGQYPSSALIKAMALNTADDQGPKGPDFTYGWGRLNASNALKSLQQYQYFENEINHGQQQSFQFPVPSGTERLKVMLYWHDAAGSVLSSRALVNDLDLSVRTPTWDIVLPWMPNSTPHLDSLAMPARAGVDRLNNVEQVVVEAPSPGYYNILVDGFQIPIGAQSYVIVYQIETSAIKINHPQDGSCFVPQEQALISWDAVGDDGVFKIDYSLDGGQSWVLMADNIAGDKRSHLWTVPITTISSLKVKISRANQISVSTGAAIIAPTPVFDITYANPAQAEINWNSIDGATGYAIYLLGERHMELLTIVNELSYLLAVNTGEEYWISVAPVFGNKQGRRANARIYQHVTCDRYVTLDIQFDQYPGETAWYILDQSGHTTESGGPYPGYNPSSFISLDLCLPEGCYTLVMTDAYNDGICCDNGNGYYELTSINGNVLVQGSEFDGFQYDLFCPEETNATTFSVTTQVIQQPNCYGQQDGAARAIVSGGSGNYTYNWSNGTHASSIQNLGAGLYQVTVVDGSNTQVQSVQIIEPSPINIQYTTQDEICADGSINVNISGGSPPYSYTWSDNGSGLLRQGLSTGNYLLIVTDANGCTQTKTIYVGEGDLLEVNLIASNPSCMNGNDGRISAIINGGQQNNYQLMWSNGQQNNQTITGLEDGMYSLTVTSGDCQDIQTVTLSNPSGLSVAASQVMPSCHNSSNGYINLNVFGGVAPYQYHWSNGAQTKLVSNLSAGVYFVTVTDNNGCHAIKAYEIDAPELLSVQADVVPIQAQVGASVSLDIEGGSSPYDVQWMHGPQGTNLVNLSAGVYTALITDQNACTASSIITIEEYDPTLNNHSYCDMQGASTAYEWIETVSVNGNQYNSGNDGGYGNYLDIQIPLILGQTQAVELTPSYSSTAYNEHWIIWIDYNQDGDFDEVNETVLSNGPLSGINITSFNIPSTALLGETRMRVAMQYSQTPISCINLNYGEVEDYTVNITSLQGIVERGNTTIYPSMCFETSEKWTAFPNPVQDWTVIKGNVQIQSSVNISVFDNAGQLITKEIFEQVQGVFEHTLDMQNYPNGSYFIEMKGEGWREILKVVK